MITKRKIWPLPPQVFVQQSDRDALQAMIAKDRFHRETMTPDDFFLPRTETVVYGDEASPITFISMSSALRIRAQFSDDVDRNRAAILSCFPALALELRNRGVNELVFDTKNPALRKFFHDQYGFERSEEMILKIF